MLTFGTFITLSVLASFSSPCVGGGYRWHLLTAGTCHWLIAILRNGLWFENRIVSGLLWPLWEKTLDLLTLSSVIWWLYCLEVKALHFHNINWKRQDIIVEVTTFTSQEAGAKTDYFWNWFKPHVQIHC